MGNVVTCGECGHLLTTDSSVQKSPSACPDCGSGDRAVHLDIAEEEDVALPIRPDLTVKLTKSVKQAAPAFRVLLSAYPPSDQAWLLTAEVQGEDQVIGPMVGVDLNRDLTDAILNVAIQLIGHIVGPDSG